MAADDPRIVLDGEQVQSYMELWGVAPVGTIGYEYCVQKVEEYVHRMSSRRFFTENIAFNIVYEDRLVLVVCVSTPTSTRVRNEQMRFMDQHGVHGIGDVYGWIQILGH